MRTLSLQPVTALEAVDLFNTIQPDTLLLIDWPHSVFCGSNCPPERVDWDYCAEHDIPVVYAPVLGASYYYRESDAIYAALVTYERITQQALLEAVCAKLQVYVPALFVDDNDLRIGSSRCGMSAPELQRADGAWLNVMEILLHSDLDEARRALAFPQDAWDHKPVSVLEDWIHPLDSEIDGDVHTVVAYAVQNAVEDLLL